MIANLPMYDRPELRDAHHAFWQEIRDHLREKDVPCPDTLDFEAGEFSAWTSPSFFFSQTCGKPYVMHLADKVTLIGTPDYNLKGCLPGYYRSAYVVHQSQKHDQLEDFKDALFAYNDDNSQSGYHVTKGFFNNPKCSGLHLNSAKMIANGHAEIAAIDAVSLKLMNEYDDFAKELKIIAWTEPTPTLPFIAYKGADQKIFFNAIQSAMLALPDEDRKKLHLKSLVHIPKETYFSAL